MVIPMVKNPTISAGNCNEEYWTFINKTVIASRTIVIVKFKSLSIPSPDPLKICIEFLQKRGIAVVGYVETKTYYLDSNNIQIWTGYRLFNLIKQDVDNWFKYYPTINGIYFDQVSNLYL